VEEYLHNFDGAAQFLIDAQNDLANASRFYQLWAEAYQDAKSKLWLGNVPRSYVDDAEIEIMARLGVQPQTYLDARRVHLVYEAGLIHRALSDLADARQGA